MMRSGRCERIASCTAAPPPMSNSALERPTAVQPAGTDCSRIRPTCPPAPVMSALGMSGIDRSVAERSGLAIPGRQHWLNPSGQMPVDIQVRIIPCNCMFILRRVEIGAFVQKVRALAQHDKAMPEARRHPQHVMIIFTQLGSYPSAERR